MAQTVPLQLGVPGGPELLIVLFLAVLLLGAGKLPKLARSTGEAIGEFEKGRQEVEAELEAMRGDSSGHGDHADPGESDSDGAGLDGEDPSTPGSEPGATQLDDAAVDTADDEAIREDEFVWGG